MHDKEEITVLLDRISDGDEKATDSLLPLVYHELRRLAHSHLRSERPDHTLNTTALVHEAYLKLVDHPPDVDWKGRSHFFAIAARVMRQVLVTYAMSRSRLKRGGGQVLLSLDDHQIMIDEKSDELIALDEALSRLETMSERQARVVECRYFAGLTGEETADVLGVSLATVKRDWVAARAWLYREIRQDARE